MPGELELFADFCGRLTLDSGRGMVLEPFQRTILTEFFDGMPETLALLPKGNGKTTLLGALALFHVCTVEDAEAVIVAAARDQAAILLKQAAGFIRRSAGLRARLLVKQREVVHRQLGGRIRVLASDADTADGLIPSLALVDELHRHKTPELYGVLRDGLGKRGGRMVTISTAGSVPEGPLWAARQAALERGAVREGTYLRAGGCGPLVLHEWSLLEGCDDPDDLVAVKRANPLAANTLELLRARHDSPSTSPWDWQRFACNLWTAAEASWLPAGAWDACREEGLEIPEGAPVSVGVDIGRKHDSSAIVACHPADGRVVVRAWVLASPGRGEHSSDLALVEGKLRELAGRFDVREVAFDPWAFTRSAQMLADEGLPMVEFPQTNSRMAPASARLLEAVNAGHLAHDGDPVLAAHVAAAVTTDTERGWRLTKRKASVPMDAAIALVLALDACDRMKGGPRRMVWTTGDLFQDRQEMAAFMAEARAYGRKLADELTGPGVR